MPRLVFLLFLVALFVWLLGCSHREHVTEDCCKADFASGKDFKVQAKHIWKKEF